MDVIFLFSEVLTGSVHTDCFKYTLFCHISTVNTLKMGHTVYGLHLTLWLSKQHFTYHLI